MSNSRKILLKDKYGNSIVVDIPNAPKPLQITEFKTEEFHWRKILIIAFVSIIIGFGVFRIIIPSVA